MTDEAPVKSPEKVVWDAVVDSVRDSISGSDNVTISREISLEGDLDADSLERLEFVMTVEEELEITIPEDDLIVKIEGKKAPRFANLGEFADHVLKIFTNAT